LQISRAARELARARLGYYTSSARLLYKLDSARLGYCTSSARARLSSTRLGSFTGLAGPPPRTRGWIRPPQKAGLGWTNLPPGPWGWFGHPQKAKTHFSFFFFFFFLGFWGWPDHPLGHGGGRTTPLANHPQTGRGGGSSHPLAKNGVAGHPIFGQGGGWSHPRFLSPPLAPFTST
jgi:hypothetical protein